MLNLLNLLHCSPTEEHAQKRERSLAASSTYKALMVAAAATADTEKLLPYKLLPSVVVNFHLLLLLLLLLHCYLWLFFWGRRRD